MRHLRNEYGEQFQTDLVYEFAFIRGSFKLRYADTAPMRPIAIPLHRASLKSAR